ncbi:N-acetylmuramoyl-L-alanine amidase [Clostridium beijerinckii]|uniref:N-acetylmuramoyl-L-alanine amidase n=1 Tax=Clostridium beijerinckii TaxID=1520 RepID=UPI0003D30673|nr:N-acetylmuramoyl-L-alanine amidase [Clostridium beijerinckii]ALB44189.1 cell wall hydrolase [Clostridium beijerinckii NRRL B-598]
MKAIKRSTTLFFAFVIVLILIPITSVKATITDIKIVSETKVTAKQAEQWAKSKGATDAFINLAKLYWKYSPEHGNVNPAVAYVQAAKETGYGKFGGVINESYHNPCGLKISAGGLDNDPNAHQKFNTWDEGVQAHLDHLALYAGVDGYPRSDSYDPRDFITIKGTVVTVNALGGKWAPSLTYGEEVNQLYNDLLVSAGIVSKSDNDTSKNSGSDNDSGKTVGTDKPQTNTTVPSGMEATKPIPASPDGSKGISSSIGWRFENGNWYYYNSDGSKVTGWIKPDSNWYYLYSDGSMAKGWSLLRGKWYYFKSSGAMQLGWIKDSNKWYYLQGDGSMITGFNLIDGRKYFLDSSGAMKTGWVSISGQWYYFNSDGSMLTGWIKPDGSWYYLYSNGVMATNWLQLNGTWYYLRSNGTMATGWILSGNAYYYLLPVSGAMAKNTVINGWQIGEDGKRGDRMPGSTNGKVIVIDPGHNFGGDDGAYSTNNGITYSERDLNMQVADKLKEKLEANGYTVIMTRKSSDREVLEVNQSLTNRVNIANNSKADLFISLHHNSADAESARGVEVYYSSKSQDESFGGGYSYDRLSKSMNVASSIASSLTNNTGAINRGAKDGNLFVCRNTTMPAVLVELGFITNTDEAKKCADSSYQDVEATAIANAVSTII